MLGSRMGTWLVRGVALAGVAFAGACGGSTSDGVDAAVDGFRFDVRADRALVDGSADRAVVDGGTGGATGGGGASGSGGVRSYDAPIGAHFGFEDSSESWAALNGGVCVLTSETPPGGSETGKALAIAYPGSAEAPAYQAVGVHGVDTPFAMPGIGSTISMRVYIDADKVPWEWMKILIVDHPVTTWNWFGGFFSCTTDCPVREWFTATYTVPDMDCEYSVPGCQTPMQLSGNVVTVGLQFAIATPDSDAGESTPPGKIYIDDVTW